MLLTIIIPTKNEAAHIARCVASLRWAADQGEAELIVVDNASADATAALAAEAGARVIACGPERSAQRNRGAAEARGAFLFFVDADMIVGKPVLEEILGRLKAHDAPDAMYVREQVPGSSLWARVRNFERGFYDGTCIDGLRVFRKDLFLKAGGFDEALYSGEDWDLDRRVLPLARNVVVTKEALIHDEGPFSLRGIIRKRRYYAKNTDVYCRKWNYDAIIRKQFGIRSRLWTVFTENGKWNRSLRRPDLLALIWAYKILIGLVAFVESRRQR